jgi:uncharacterized protein (DUF2147 family)
MRALSIIFAFVAPSAVQAQPRAPIEGNWKNPIGSAIITVAPCGDLLCGKVAWASARGQREASTSTSNVVGTTVLTGFKQTGNRWTGRLFIPDDNVHVSAKLQLLGERQLKLTGCAVAGLFCRSQIWTRYDGPLPASP